MSRIETQGPLDILKLGSRTLGAEAKANQNGWREMETAECASCQTCKCLMAASASRFECG